MLLTKLKIATAAIALFVLAGGAVILTSHAQEGKNDPDAPKQVKEDDKPKDAPVAREPSPERSEARYEGKPIAYWIDRLQKAENDEMRSDAAEAITQFGADAGPAVPALLEMLDDHSSKFRDLAIYILEVIADSSAKTVVPALVKSLKDGRARHPDSVINVIGGIGPEAKDAVQVLIQALEDRRLWKPAVIALCRVGPSQKEAAPAIGRAIRDARARHEQLEGFFNLLIGGLGPVQIGNVFQPREAAIPLLTELLDDKDAQLKTVCTGIERHGTARKGGNAETENTSQGRLSRPPFKRRDSFMAYRKVRRGCSRSSIAAEAARRLCGECRVLAQGNRPGCERGCARVERGFEGRAGRCAAQCSTGFGKDRSQFRAEVKREREEIERGASCQSVGQVADLSQVALISPRCNKDTSPHAKTAACRRWPGWHQKRLRVYWSASTSTASPSLRTKVTPLRSVR